MTERDHAPIACTLYGRSYQERLKWLADLARDGLRSHSRRDLVLDLRYTPEVADRVRDLVRMEGDCCAFLDFELTETSDEVRLTITAPERAREVASELFDEFVSTSTSAESAPSNRSDRAEFQR